MAAILSKGRWVNSLRWGQSGAHFTEGIFKCTFLKEKACIWIKISLKFVPMDPIYKLSALVHLFGISQIGDKPLSEPMMAQFTNVYMSLGLD